MVRLAKTLPKRKLLQRYRVPDDGHPARNVHGDRDGGEIGRLAGPVVGNDGGPCPLDREAQTALHGRAHKGVCGALGPARCRANQVQENRARRERNESSDSIRYMQFLPCK